MIDELKPYPKYKDSGVPWLGEVPEHWEVRRLKNIFREIDERSTAGSESLLSLRMDHGLVDHHALGGKVISPEALIGYKKTVPGEIVMNRMRAAAGLFAATSVPGLVSPDYAVLRPRVQIVHEYFVRLFRTPALMSVFRAESRGLGTGESGFLRLYTERFGEIASPSPSIEEQRAIARYLGYQDRRISRYIRAKKKLIALLNEQKQAIIHHAVTRGLDPNVALKPSGVEWLGDVPEHWTLKRFKFVARVTSGQIDPTQPEHRTRVLIAPNHIRSGSGKIELLETAAEQGADSGKYKVIEGQIVYSKIRPALRKAAIAPIDCLCSADMYPITVGFELRPEYALLLLLSEPFTRYAVDSSLRVAMPKVNRQALGEAWMWYPDVPEQSAILGAVAGDVRPVEAATDEAERAIALLRDFRTRLISDIVTGKLDVREAAASLPVEEVADELPEISDTLEDIEEDTEDGGGEVEE